MWFAGIVILGALLALAYGIYTMVTVPSDDLDARMDAQRIPMIEIPQNAE
jgi:predicted outer membrane lipoprotein